MPGGSAMALRINHDPVSLNTWRWLATQERGLTRSLERLSSGLRINRASDAPAGLVISQNLRARIVGLDQAIENSAIAAAEIQTAEGALVEIHALLRGMRELAVHAANAGANDAASLAADQAEIEDSLASIRNIVDQTRFGDKQLLDGSNGVRGTISGLSVSPQSFRFLGATQDTAAGDFVVDVTTAASQATVQTANSAPITGIAADETLTLAVASTGVSVEVGLAAGDDAQTIADRINAAAAATWVRAYVVGNDLRLISEVYGSRGDFTVASDNPAADGSQSGFAGGAGDAGAGADIAGTYTWRGVARQADGEGAVLAGRAGTVAAGLRVRYTGAIPGNVGSVRISNDSLRFQVGSEANQQVTLAIDAVSPETLGVLAEEPGGGNRFASLAEIHVLDPEAAGDAMALIDAAIEEVSSLRGRLGAFQSQALASGLNNLGVARENLVAAESRIRDTDMAAEVAVMARHAILLQAAATMLAHAGAAPRSVLTLLR
ncbi:MAG: hypothetical protein JW819_08560 [Candidatus Krumholzibacteriota bacterium]|nr:hypothetical protein [Candidatus Krumholzibacteriota bacterium]